MQNRPEAVQVLLVEDDEDDFLITRDLLERQERARFKVEWCSDYEGALEAIADARHDVYLIDYRLGSRNGLDLVRQGFASRPKAPVIVLTGQADYEIDLEASALGVTDFMLKQELNPYSLERALRYAINHHRALRDLAVSEERYALAACAVNDGIWDWDLGTDLVYYSPRWQALLGLDEDARLVEAGVPDTWFDLVHEDDLPGLRLAIEAHLSGRTSLLQSKHRIRHADGTWRWVLTRGMAVRDSAGEPTRMAGSLSDITISRRTERQLQHDALHDTLTGLPNRALFIDRVERSMMSFRREPSRGCAVLFLDIDRFKLVNDTFSHTVGDWLLIALAARIVSEIEPEDTVARMAGDEFTILLDGRPSANLEARALEVAARINEILRGPFNIDGHRLFVTASIGIGVPEPDISASDLIRNADIAMYEAKHRDRGGCMVYHDSMHRRISDRLLRQNDLREVIERGLIEVYYQPVLDLASGRIHGFEALARWPEGWPALSPSEFIPIAEETGLITPLGLHVLRTALGTLAAWRTDRLVGPDVRMSVNVSGRQLDDPRFPEDVIDVIAATGLPGSVVRLEITEGTLMREPERIARIVSEVCSTGVGLELDDFGTGYSSLASLHQFPVNALKIDQSFVAALTAEEGEVIVRTTIALAHSLGLEVIAEGIEREDQMQRLRSLGCEHGQGFLFSPPVPRQAAENLLRGWSSPTGTGEKTPGLRLHEHSPA
ncbi:MAG TPA: EAL domain-containing protein [Acidimicrobiales bacterium]|nr:EAL domain-containing protein [Acidimicrobiales bacterium]